MPAGPSTADRRQFWRAAFHSPVRIGGPAGSSEGRLLDLSLKGALVEVGGELHIDDRCDLELALSADVAIRMETVVSHVAGQRVGLRCEHIDLDSITHLRRLVELNAGDAALLDRELSALVQA